MIGLLAAAQSACTESNEGDTDAAGGAPGVTSTELVRDLTLAAFTALCDEAGGIVETHAHCGGVVSGPGFSYDSDTDELTEHTCAGVNTCTGFSCVIDA
jgi:hypothetical protein